VVRDQLWRWVGLGVWLGIKGRQWVGLGVCLGIGVKMGRIRGGVRD